MQLYISDIHLGSPLLRFSSVIARILTDPKYTKIVINGDIIDTWEAAPFKIVQNNLSIIQAINRIARQKEVVIIQGNHDPSIGILKRIFPKIAIYDDVYADGDSVFLHGHQFDFLMEDFVWLGKSLYSLQKLAERMGLDVESFIREMLHSVSAKRQKKYYNDLVIAIEKNAVKRFTGLYKYIFMGHTHLPKLVRTPVVTYTNTGDWIHNYTYAERDGDTIRVLDVSGKEYKHEDLT